MLLPPSDLVFDEQRQEFRVGELTVYGLTITDFQRVKNAGQPQLFQQGQELWHGMHDVLLTVV